MGIGRKRTRSIPSEKKKIGTLQTIDTWNGKIISSIDHYAGGTYPKLIEECYDRTHPHYKRGKGRFKEHLDDLGGNLDLRKLEVKNEYTSSRTVGSSSGVYVYHGQFISNKIPSGLVVPGTCLGDLLPYAAAGWHKFKPGKAKASLGVFLGELRDMPGMLKEALTRFTGTWKYIQPNPFRPKGRKTSKLVHTKPGSFFPSSPVGAARDYLSYQFGWLPFVKDVLDFIQLSQEVEDLLRKLKENNNRWRRRGGDMVNKSETTQFWSGTDWGCLYPTLPTPCYRAAPTYIKRTKVNQHVWFSGCYRYYIPELESSRIPYNTIRKLAGLSFTPDVFWNLIPWSWLVDWTQSVGKTIGFLNDGAAENLATKYAYVMGTWRTETQHSVSASFGRGGTVSLETTVSSTMKGRLPAHPFGFALPPDSLNLRQLSILGALGVSRL